MLWHLKKKFLSFFFSTRFKPRTHASITLASRIPLSKRECNHRYHRRLVCYYHYYYYHLLCCMHAIGRLPLSLQRSSCDRSRRFVTRNGNACMAEPASRVKWPRAIKCEQSRDPGVICIFFEVIECVKLQSSYSRRTFVS